MSFLFGSKPQNPKDVVRQEVIEWYRRHPVSLLPKVLFILGYQFALHYYSNGKPMKKPAKSQLWPLISSELSHLYEPNRMYQPNLQYGTVDLVTYNALITATRSPKERTGSGTRTARHAAAGAEAHC